MNRTLWVGLAVSLVYVALQFVVSGNYPWSLRTPIYACLWLASGMTPFLVTWTMAWGALCWVGPGAARVTRWVGILISSALLCLGASQMDHRTDPFLAIVAVTFPLYLATALAIVFSIAVAAHRFIVGREPSGTDTVRVCPKCEYDLTGIEAAQNCPECGQRLRA